MKNLPSLKSEMRARKKAKTIGRAQSHNQIEMLRFNQLQMKLRKNSINQRAFV